MYSYYIAATLLFCSFLSSTNASSFEVHVLDGQWRILVNSQVWFESAPKPQIYLSGELAHVSLSSSTIKHENSFSYVHNSSVQIYTFPYDISSSKDRATTYRAELLISYFSDIDIVEFNAHFIDTLTNTSVPSGSSDAVCASLIGFDTEKISSDVNLAFTSWKGNMIADKNTLFGSFNKKGLRESTTTTVSGIDGGILMLLAPNGKDTMFLTASSQFMSANIEVSTNEEEDSGIVSLGVMGMVKEIPAGFQQAFVFAFSDEGPNAAADHWGTFLRRKFDKTSTLRESDFALNHLGYSTDNGAYYYYKTMNDTGRWKEPDNFEPTQMALKKYADSENIPYQYILLDSWWYPKGPKGGVVNWTAMPSVYPHGLQWIWEQSNWWVQGHNRYWSAETSYAKANGGDYDFIIESVESGGSGFAIPTEQRFWDDLFANSTKWGLKTYEQDWLYNEFSELKCTLESATLAREWLLQMGTAAAKNDLRIQYCMPWPRHVLQSVEIPSVTNFRASDDYHPGNNQYKLGMSSMIARALGLGPSKDNYWSTSDQPNSPYGDNPQEHRSELQSLVSSLTRGPVAPSDMLGKSNATLINRACRSDGVLLKPHQSLALHDNCFHYRAFGQQQKGEETPSNVANGEIYWTFSELHEMDRHYIVVGFDLESGDYTLDLQGVYGPNVDTDIKRLQYNSNGDVIWFDDKNPIVLKADEDFTLRYTATLLENDWAILGELNKWVPVARERIQRVQAQVDGFLVVLTGEAGENVTLSFAKLEDGKINRYDTTCTVNESGSVQMRVSSNTHSCTSL